MASQGHLAVSEPGWNPGRGVRARDALKRVSLMPIRPVHPCARAGRAAKARAAWQMRSRILYDIRVSLPETSTQQSPVPDWDARAEEVLEDQIAAYDRMRQRCPVAFSEYRQWSLFRHEDVVRVLGDPETFSSEVSRYLSVPNGMDPPEHTVFRSVIDPYFAPDVMEWFEPICRKIAVELIERLPHGEKCEVIAGFAEDFALRIQSAFMGWPETLHEPLREWTRRNHAATLAADREAMAEVAMDFDSYIQELLRERREAGDLAPDDVTTRLMRERPAGRPLTDAEFVSLVRNWTVGELATIAASVGILMHFLATHPGIQQRLRDRPDLLPGANDEILRIHAPLISNRRRAAKAAEIGGRSIEPGAGISINWASANRDERVFGDPDEFRLDRDPEANLLYGKGIHACPGAPLARLELRVLMEELLARTRAIRMVDEQMPVNAPYPASGFLSLYLEIERRD